MALNYELYKVFYQVARDLSFSKAAEKLFISQSAVSQNIKNLEKELKTDLFIRSTKKVQLTEAGKILFEHIEPAFNLIENGEKSIREINSLERGEIHIGANDTISKDFLLPYLKKYHRLYPEIQIQITNRTSSTCIDLLQQNKVDLIISNLPNPKITDQMESQEIYSFNDLFIAGSEFKDLRKKEIKLKELKNYPLLMLESKTTTRRFLENALNNLNIEVEAAVELGSIDLLIEMTKIGLGIALVPEYCLNLKQENLFEIKTKEKLPARKLAVITNKDIPLSKAAEKFIELFDSKPNLTG
ncbi:DNA-binding transcriptional LysR family regulator [Halanaerobium saccharolyticum]|uniref:DNA-binding transcriptional LysR family regulator n=1 Tax=Halanaerobium saccharolyticum TaxID=43595 RepID=A0A4R7YL23_9FIRM|nr:LysR family transcriptional regulator [Halanaerobium saccharolyticum]RAK04869.1 DNA-binding transcriptional LysR family regulator [Halanaerobium saccharolyticum]TDV98266.1 DNA-binding transcriptional LysR family regulator [Halanaerobium saccharolyticum]TDX51113.1 DNA-binding transcriptional LysR family regulator [Halanaerobium saccharolyticum]